MVPLNPLVQSIPRETLQERVVQRGIYDHVVNKRIYREFFVLTRPKDRMFLEMARKYCFQECLVCDVGCGWGAHLANLPIGYGIEIDSEKAKFAQSIGLTVYVRDVVEDTVSDLPRVDIVWCSATIEHVDSPHILLRKLNNLLKPRGLLVLEAPVQPPFPWLGRLPLPKFKHLFLDDHGDHVNAFTPETLRYSCERAGFETIEVLRCCMPVVNRLRWLTPSLTGMPPLNLIARACVYVGRKADNWAYPLKSTSQTAETTRGYARKS